MQFQFLRPFSPLILCLCFVPAPMLSAADTSNDVMIQNEIDDLGDIYRVVAPNKSLAMKAAISFHANLLESDTKSATHIMSLNADEIEKLERFGFKVFAHPQWAEKYRQHRLLFLQSKQIEAQLDDASTESILMQGIEGYACYPTVEETYQQASNLAAANPQLASWFDIGDSWKKSTGNGGYDLMVLKITNSAIGGDKPKLFIHSAVHPIEYPTAALTLEFATQLLNQYAVNADITWIVDWHEVHILFHMNPDGRKIAEQFIRWRKNTNTDYCASSGSRVGADLNRNFTHFWNITNGQGSSSDPCSHLYRGPFAASEPETQAVENYVRSQFVDNRGSGENDAAPLDTTGIHLDIHSAGELILWPYGHTNTPAPNETGLQTLGRKLAFWNGYLPQQAIGLYPTDGTSRNVSYGELGVPVYTFELGTSHVQDCSTYENTIKPDNLPALIYAAKVVREPYRIPAGPEVHSLTFNGQENITIMQSDSVNLSALADDGRYQNSNGIEPQQTVVQAEYFMDSPPWEGTAAGNPMNPADDSFNSSAETIDAVIDTTGLSLGKHPVYVRAMDANGQWGAISSGFVTVLEFIDSDGDGVSDNIDAFPNDPTETLDNDNDGIGNNADTDDDNDTIPDDWEVQFGLDPLNADDANTDLDNDGISNLAEFLNNSDPTDIESPNPSILVASATPQIENAIIDEAGEVLKYARIIENATDATVKAKRVEIIKFSDGTPYVYAKYNAMKLGPFALSKALNRKITVKDWWPAGDYQLELHALTEILARGTSDSFSFSKAGIKVSQTANIEVHAIPADASPSVTAEGGKITFQRKLLNNTAETQHVKRWEIIEFPNGALYGYSSALAFQLGSNGVNQQLSRKLTIPSWFPSGHYIYHHHALTEESPVGVHASFSFTKAE